MPTPVNVATPRNAVAVAVPTTVTPALTLIVTTLLLVVTVLPPASCTATTGCVVKAAPFAAPAAFVINTKCVGTIGASGLVPQLSPAKPSASAPANGMALCQGIVVRRRCSIITPFFPASRLNAAPDSDEKRRAIVEARILAFNLREWVARASKIGKPLADYAATPCR